MFVGQFPINPQPQQLNLRETDALTELCNVAESVVPHHLNTEYRLKRVFVDASGLPRDPSTIPVLSPHEHVQFYYQAQRFGSDDDRNAVPVPVLGFGGLKARFDTQNKAIGEQDAMITIMKERLQREIIAFRNNCRERLRKQDVAMAKTESRLLAVFKVLEARLMQQATHQRKTSTMKSSFGSVMSELTGARRTMRDENLKARILSLEQTIAAQGTPEMTAPSAPPPTEDVEQIRILLRQSRQMLNEVRATVEACEKDQTIMRSKKKKTDEKPTTEQLL